MNRSLIYLITAVALGTSAASCSRRTEEIKPVRKDITLTVFAAGQLEAENTYHLTAQTDGQLITVNFNEGDHVNNGDVLAVIENYENVYNTESAAALLDIAKSNVRTNAPAYTQAVNNAEAARQKMLLDSVQFVRYEKLAAKKSVSQADFENVRQQYINSKANFLNLLEAVQLSKQEAGRQLINSENQNKLSRLRWGQNELRAVSAGKVYEKRKQTGDYVRKGDVIAVIGSAEEIMARVNVDENNIRTVKTGQLAQIKLNTIPGKIYSGVVTEILPAFDESAQSFVCKIKFTDSLDFKITGTQLQSNIVIGEHKKALLIPRRFLQYDGTVNVKGQDNPIPVKAEFTGTDWVEITEGINENVVLVAEITGK
jgi:multidrug efflux pump subunit AcrA (membrane-fusion protein)